MASSRELIAVDLDEVLLSTVEKFIEFHNKSYGTSARREDITNYVIASVFGTSYEENSRRWFEFYDSDEFGKIEPVELAVDGILELRKSKDLAIVTKRPDFLRGRTESSIKEYFGDAFTGIYFCNVFNGKSRDFQDRKKLNKSDVCLQLGAKTIIEDSLKYSIDCINKGIKAILLDCPWNKSDKEFEHNQIERVYSWPEIVEKVY